MGPYQKEDGKWYYRPIKRDEDAGPFETEDEAYESLERDLDVLESS